MRDRITCSNLARPMVCAGYVHLDLPKERDKGHADEGIAAGQYLERVLMKLPLGDMSTDGYYFDDDIKFYGNAIAEDVITRAGSNEILCEQKINWQTASGLWITGRPDITFVNDKDVLCIEDYKYGHNLVEVKENWQLLGYAIGEVIRRARAFNEISLKIHQPRPHHEDGSTREWVLTYPELLHYKERIEDRMTEIVHGRREFQTSKECKYCLGTGEACPAFNRLFYRSLEITTEFFQDSIDNDELATQLDQVKRAEEVIKIKKDSLTELGSLRIKEGQIIPGYVQSKTYTHRQWKGGISPEAIKMMTGLNVIEKKFMSPAKAEKLGVPKQLTDTLTEKKFKGVKLEKKDINKIGNDIFGNKNPIGGK